MNMYHLRCKSDLLILRESVTSLRDDYISGSQETVQNLLKVIYAWRAQEIEFRLILLL